MLVQFVWPSDTWSIVRNYPKDTGESVAPLDEHRGPFNGRADSGDVGTGYNLFESKKKALDAYVRNFDAFRDKLSKGEMDCGSNLRSDR